MSSPLKSKGMALSFGERHWLPWLGRTGKLAMGWSCWLNRGSRAELEKVFEGIAQTRVRLLQTWAHGQWSWLAELAEGLARDFTWLDSQLLADKRVDVLVDVLSADPPGRAAARLPVRAGAQRCAR